MIILFPSGEKLPLFPHCLVTSVEGPPSTDTVYRRLYAVGAVSRSEAYKILEPSGVQPLTVAAAGYQVSLLGSPPVTGTI